MFQDVMAKFVQCYPHKCHKELYGVILSKVAKTQMCPSRQEIYSIVNGLTYSYDHADKLYSVIRAALTYPDFGICPAWKTCIYLSHVFCTDSGIKLIPIEKITENANLENYCIEILSYPSNMDKISGFFDIYNLCVYRGDTYLSRAQNFAYFMNEVFDFIEVYYG